jgi:hypothetical protein
MPANAMPIVSSVVAIGRAMKGALMFMMAGREESTSFLKKSSKKLLILSASAFSDGPSLVGFGLSGEAQPTLVKVF